MKKVRKINNCLVGGAGRLSSVIAFFEWFEKWSDAQVVQGEAPHVTVFVPEGINDEDFHGLVIFSDRVIFYYEGGKTSYSLENQEYVAIGSGADYALAAMDAGLSAEEAVKVAIGRDVYSGGQVFIETLDPEPEEITRESAEKMSQAELLDLIFGEVQKTNEELDKDDLERFMIYSTESLALFADGAVMLNPPGAEEGYQLDILKTGLDENITYVAKKLKRSYLEEALKEVFSSIITGQPDGPDWTAYPNKRSILEYIIQCMQEVYEAEVRNVEK